jgi:two-component system phosphate regulon response regulator OmpR
VATVLVVDDDADARLLLRAVLESEGLEVVDVEDGASALDVVEGRPDLRLVLLDLHMPGLDGRDVLDRIRAHPSSAALPVMVRSGSTEVDEEVALLRAGADDVVSKADAPHRLLARVHALLRRTPPSSSV